MLVEGPNQLKSRGTEELKNVTDQLSTYQIVGEKILYYEPFLLLLLLPLLLYQTSFRPCTLQLRTDSRPFAFAFRFKRSTSVIHKVYAHDAFTRSCIQSRHV